MHKPKLLRAGVLEKARRPNESRVVRTAKVTAATVRLLPWGLAVRKIP